MNETWQKTLVHLSEGNFTALEQMLGGPEEFDRQILEWFKAGRFNDEPEMLAEALSCACMLGRTETASFLIDSGVDPYAGMRTWLAGPHYAASSGRIEVIKMLIEKNIPLEVKNRYGGTVLGQALWSAVNEYADSQAEVIECLILAGAVVEPGTLEWWQEQAVPVPETKLRVKEVLRRYKEFQLDVDKARKNVDNAESGGSKQLLADTLKVLGNLLRRRPYSRNAANEAYHRASELYQEIEMPLEAAWVIRHIGFNHEYAERLTDAERCYDESLKLFRRYARDNDPNYANTVRYSAVIKNRVGKREGSKELWEEAVKRYEAMDQPLGVAEGAGWLTIFAIERGDGLRAREWFTKAETAARRARDSDTDKWIEDVRAKLNNS
jgi:tetratricopeptide (TPR) repeat protein